MESAMFCSMRVILHDRQHNDPSKTTCVTSSQDDSSETYSLFCSYLQALSQGCRFFFNFKKKKKKNAFHSFIILCILGFIYVVFLGFGIEKLDFYFLLYT